MCKKYANTWKMCNTVVIIYITDFYNINIGTYI
jgi:hypothetical protein